MRTDDLVSWLAADATPVRPHAGRRRVGLAMGAGALLSLAWVAAVYGWRADLGAVWSTPAFALKLAMPLSVVVATIVVVHRLAHPGARVGGWGTGAGLPVIALWGWAAVVLADADPASRTALVLGETWRVCVFNVMASALPVALMLLWALRGLAPTRPAWAGAAAGWLAGATGAAAYALHCPEMQAPFLAVWYVAGMAACALLGAGIGARLLRW